MTRVKLDPQLLRSLLREPDKAAQVPADQRLQVAAALIEFGNGLQDSDLTGQQLHATQAQVAAVVGKLAAADPEVAKVLREVIASVAQERGIRFDRGVSPQVDQARSAMTDPRARRPGESTRAWRRRLEALGWTAQSGQSPFQPIKPGAGRQGAPTAPVSEEPVVADRQELLGGDQMTRLEQQATAIPAEMPVSGSWSPSQAEDPTDLYNRNYRAQRGLDGDYFYNRQAETYGMTDSDGDGIPNRLDPQPNVFNAALPVGSPDPRSYGAYKPDPLDADGDRIPDYIEDSYYNQHNKGY